MADGVTCGFVSGNDEQDEEAAKFLRRHAVAVHHGVHHHAGEVVGGVLQTGFTQRLRVGEDLERNSDQVLERSAKVRVTGAKDDIGPVQNLALVAFWNAHHFANDLQRERCGDVVDEIKLGVAKLFDGAVHDGAGFVFHVLLNACNFFWCEALRNNGAQSHVFRVVHADHGAKEFVEFHREVGDVGAFAAAEQVWVAAGMPDVLVLGERPIAGPNGEVDEGYFLKEFDGGLATQGGKG